MCCSRPAVANAHTLQCYFPFVGTELQTQGQNVQLPGLKPPILICCFYMQGNQRRAGRCHCGQIHANRSDSPCQRRCITAQLLRELRTTCGRKAGAEEPTAGQEMWTSRCQMPGSTPCHISRTSVMMLSLSVRLTGSLHQGMPAKAAQACFSRILFNAAGSSTALLRAESCMPVGIPAKQPAVSLL